MRSSNNPSLEKERNIETERREVERKKTERLRETQRETERLTDRERNKYSNIVHDFS